MEKKSGLLGKSMTKPTSSNDSLQVNYVGCQQTKGTRPMPLSELKAMADDLMNNLNRNIHPVDELAEIREEIKLLTARADKLRDQLLEEGADLTGDSTPPASPPACARRWTRRRWLRPSAKPSSRLTSRRPASKP